MMQYTLKLAFADAKEIRVALVERVRVLKLIVGAKLATDDEKMMAARTILTLESVLRREYGDYHESETNPKN